MSKETLTIDQVEEIYQLIKYAFYLLDVGYYFFDEEGNDVVNSFQYDEKVLQENLKHHYSTKNLCKYNHLEKYSRLPEKFVKQVKVIIRKGSTFTHKCKVDETISDEFLIPFIHYVYKNEFELHKEKNESPFVYILYVGQDDMYEEMGEKGVYNDKELLFKDYQILRQKILDRPYIRCYIDVYEVNKGFKKFYEASQFFKLFLNKSESIWK